jgi:hypothetical protein
MTPIPTWSVTHLAPIETGKRSHDRWAVAQTSCSTHPFERAEWQHDRCVVIEAGSVSYCDIGQHAPVPGLSLRAHDATAAELLD